MDLFKSAKKDSYLGVDIGASSIKIVEIGLKDNRPTLLTYGYSQRPLGQTAVSPFDDPATSGALLAKICQQAGTKSTKAMTALPLSNIFSSIIAVPKNPDKKKMKEQIDAQIARLTPLPLAEMVTYSTFLDGDKTADEKSYERVLITGTARTLVQKFIEIFRVAKLELQAIDTESFALIRALVGKDKSTVLILDLGYQRTNLTIVDKGIPYLVRSINLGGATLTRKIMETMHLSEDQAEQVKTDMAFSEAGNGKSLPSILQAVLQPIVNEIEYAFQVFGNMELAESRRVEKVILTGGSAHLPHLVEFFSNALNMSVYRGDPWARLVTPADLHDLLEEIGPRMGVAVGLAMREIEK